MIYISMSNFVNLYSNKSDFGESIYHDPQSSDGESDIMASQQVLFLFSM